MYTWTKTWQMPYGNWMRVIMYRNDLTGTYTAGDGFIVSVSPVKKGIDLVTGEYQPGSVTIEFRNTDNNLSDYIFSNVTPITGDIQLEIWLSDDNVTWENEFIGFIELENLFWQMRDTVETRNRSYTVTASDALLRLKTVDFFNAATYAATYAEPTTQAPRMFGVDENELKFEVYPPTPTGMTFISLSNLFLSCIKTIPFVNPPATLAVSFAECEHRAKNDHLATEFAPSTWNIIHTLTLDPVFTGEKWIGSNVWTDSGFPSSGYDAKNVQEFLKRWAYSILCIPVPQLVGTTYTLNMIPRYKSVQTAIGSGLGTLKKFSRQNADWVWGGQVNSIGLPVKFITGGAAKGATIQCDTRIVTSLDVTGNDDLFFIRQPFIRPPFTQGGDWCFDTLAGTLFVRQSANDFRTVHRLKYTTAQAYQATTVDPDYYASAECIYNLVLDSAGNFLTRGFRNAYTAEYKRIRTASYQDVRILKSITLNGETCTINEVSRDASKNETIIKAVKNTVL